MSNDKVEYIHGRAHLTGKNEAEVVLDDGTKQTIKAKKILLAVGGHPTIPQNIPGSEYGKNSDGFFDIEKQPKRVALVGAGYIAVEFAGMFKDDPDFQEVQEIMAENRRKMDEDETIP